MTSKKNNDSEGQSTLRNYTRVVKNAKYLQMAAPHIMPTQEPREGFSNIIPSDILAKLHLLRYDSPELSAYPALAEFLKENRIPGPSRTGRTPLFSGTFHFVQVTFHIPSGTLIFPSVDMNMMVQYAQHAIVPITQYATQQYGSNSPTVSATLLTYSVTLTGTSYTDSDLQGWVNDIVNTNHLPSDSCVIIPSPQGLSCNEVGGNSGYHSKANVPYIVFGVYAQNLTLQDLPDVYAMVISHEMAEVVVDPAADWAVGEVGDPCDVNCLHANFYRAYFDIFDNYLGTNKLTPPSGFNFSYYICPVVKSEGIAHSGSDCHATDADCNYPPVAQDFYFTVIKNTFGRDEVQDTLNWSNAFLLFLEGFTPNGVDSSTPILTGSFKTGINGLTIVGRSPIYQLGNDPTNANTPQRIIFGYDIQFTNDSLNAFPASGAAPIEKLLAATITIQGQLLSFNPETIFELVGGADPYFTNVDSNQDNVFWLSQDLRVFTATPAVNNTPIANGPVFSADTIAGAFSYIQSLLTHLNNNYSDPLGIDPFSNVLPNQAGALTGDSSVTPFTLQPPSQLYNNYNFAIARVRLRGTSGTTNEAQNVKVFFRLWSTQTADTDYQPGTTYLSNLDANNLPVSPLVGTNNHTIPFFATGNFSSNTDYSLGGVNNRTIQIPVGHRDIWAYFGCFLNLYDSGNIINGQQIQHWLNGTHHCVVAQIAYDDAPIVNANGVTLSPENSDKLAQRNLQVTHSDNPGATATHRIPQTFDTRPSQVVSQQSVGMLSYPDELMIDWGNTPSGSTASIYWPQVSASQVLQLASQMYTSHLLSARDSNTLQCQVTSGVTFIPIPADSGPGFAGLFTVDLPPTVVKGEEFNIVVRRLTTKRIQNQLPIGRTHSEMGIINKSSRNWRYVVGTFQIKIPVSSKNDLLFQEETTLAIFKWRLQSLSLTNRWYPVLERYIAYLSARIDAWGGNSNAIKPSLQGVPVKSKDYDEETLEYTGKVCEVIYDCFGDFEGFVLDTCTSNHLFKTREKAIGEVALRACRERLLLSIFVQKGREQKIFKLVFRC